MRLCRAANIIKDILDELGIAECAIFRQASDNYVILEKKYGAGSSEAGR